MKGIKKHPDINLINQIEKISKKSARCGLKLESIEGVTEELAIIVDFLQITPIQAILFSTIVELSLIKRINLESLSRYYKCSPLTIVGMMGEIDSLIHKGLVRKIIRSGRNESSFNDIYFKVPNDVIEGIQNKDQSVLTKHVKFDLPKFLEKVHLLYDERKEDLISTKQLVVDTEELIKNNQNLHFVEFVNNRLIKTINKTLVFVLAFAHLMGRAEFELAEFAEEIFDDISDQFMFQQNLMQERHELITKGFLSIMHSEFAGAKLIQISNNVMSTLFQGHEKLRVQDFNSGLLMKPESIKIRQLFFNSGLQDEIHTLQKTLTDRKYKCIKRQLEQRKFCSGLTILLYGYSGTGKTEVVYQIAKKTGREIMMVDLSETKSKWFGESEKQVKKIFDDYRLVVRNSKITPILFINEVDGLLSKRQSIGNNATSALHALNTMQNILLQEMESFDGILFATTNLTENLDKAFDRRFLFKLKFTHPDPESRHKIWKSKLPEISLKQASMLSEKYELTGGQIENVVRQSLLAQMVNNHDLYEILNKHCMQESEYGSNNRIGY